MVEDNKDIAFANSSLLDSIMTPHVQIGFCLIGSILISFGINILKHLLIV